MEELVSKTREEWDERKGQERMFPSPGLSEKFLERGFFGLESCDGITHHTRLYNKVSHP